MLFWKKIDFLVPGKNFNFNFFKNMLLRALEKNIVSKFAKYWFSTLQRHFFQKLKNM
jgi:hypothetical protein